MGQLRVAIEDFSVMSSYSCVYHISEDGTEVLNRYVTEPNPGNEDAIFSIDLPVDTHITGVVLHATTGYSDLGKRSLTINGVEVEMQSTVSIPIDAPEKSTSITVPFAYTCRNSIHTTHGLTFTTPHNAWVKFSNVYLLVDYEADYTAPELVEYTDPNPISGETYVKAIHMTELHTNVNRIRVAYKFDEYAFSQITAGETSLGGWNSHVLEIRSALDELAIAHDNWIVLGDNCPRVDVLLQLRSVAQTIAEG